MKAGRTSRSTRSRVGTSGCARIQELLRRSSGRDPPAFSERERGCLRRAFVRLAGRVAPLCALLGQMIRPIKPSVGECWEALRELDNLEGILLLLGQKFNTLASRRLPLSATRIVSGKTAVKVADLVPTSLVTRRDVVHFQSALVSGTPQSSQRNLAFLRTS